MAYSFQVIWLYRFATWSRPIQKERAPSRGAHGRHHLIGRSIYRLTGHRPSSRPAPQRTVESIPWVSTTTPSLEDRPSPRRKKERSDGPGAPRCCAMGSGCCELAKARSTITSSATSRPFISRPERTERQQYLARSHEDPKDRISSARSRPEGMLAGALGAGSRPLARA